MCCGTAAEGGGPVCVNTPGAKEVTRLGRLGSEHPPVVRAGREVLAGLGVDEWRYAKEKSDPGGLTRGRGLPTGIIAGAQERRSAGAQERRSARPVSWGGVMVAPPPGGALRPASPDSTGRRLGRGFGVYPLLGAAGAWAPSVPYRRAAGAAPAAGARRSGPDGTDPCQQYRSGKQYRERFI